jgi:hypothetical protein
LPGLFNIQTTIGTRIQKRTETEMKGNHMKLKIIALACAAIAPLALAQTRPTGEGPTSTGERDIAAAPNGEIGYVNELTPGKSIKVTRSGAGAQPVVYRLAPNVRYVDEAGRPVHPDDIQAGTRVRLDMTGRGPGLTVDRVVVIQAK